MPYPITGTDPANMEARLYGSYGTAARLASTRLGYHDPRVVVLVAGTHRESAIDKPTLRVDAQLGAPATATFSAFDSWTPVVGQEVKICTGSETNVIFGGHIVSVTKRYENLQTALRYDVEVQDYTWLLNRRLVSGRYGDASANVIADSIVSSYSSGFTVAPRLGTTVDEIVFTEEPVGDALRRVAAAVSGFVYVDPQKSIHIFVTDSTTRPHDLTTSYTDFRKVYLETDLSQIRTRVRVRGLGTTIAARITASEKANILKVADYLLPVADQSVFSPFTTTRSVRLKSQSTVTLKPFTGAEPTTVGTTMTASASKGATSISVADCSLFTAFGWAICGDVLFCYTSVSGSTTLAGIPSSGTGSITAPLANGASISQAPYLAVSDIPINLAIGDAIEAFSEVEDTTAQTALAALEGGDGIHEYAVADGRLGFSGVAARAAAELAAYKNTLDKLTYQTMDPSTIPGLSVTANLAAPTSIAGTYRIQRVTIDQWELAPDHHPWRTVEATAARRPLSSVLIEALR